MSPKKSAPTKPAKKASSKSTPVKIERTPNSIHIDYSDPKDLLPHLADLVSEFTEKHLESAATLEGVLGTDAAKRIVSGCANSTCWTCTLADLKLDSTLFQDCVYAGVKAAKHSIRKSDIPATQDTQLYAVVMAIQGAQ